MARIIIIDDEPLVRNLVRATLDFGEHELIEAHDGPSALAIAGVAHPELVILDLGLPGNMSGLEVHVPDSTEVPARGAALFGAVAGEAFPDIRSAISATRPRTATSGCTRSSTTATGSWPASSAAR